MAVFMICSMAPYFLFVFYRKWLDNPVIVKWLKRGGAGMALLGIILTVFGIGERRMYLLLTLPFMSIYLYGILSDIFKRKFNRAPIDTAYDWRSGLFWDRCFNIGYAIFGILLPWLTILFIMDFIDKK